MGLTKTSYGDLKLKSFFARLLNKHNSLINIFFSYNISSTGNFKSELLRNIDIILNRFMDLFTNGVKVTLEKTKFGLARLSVFLPKFINIILVKSFNLSFSDFRTFFFSNVLTLLQLFYFKF